MSNFDDLSMAVASFGGNNAVKFDDLGMPSIMVAIPKMKYSDIITGGNTGNFAVVDCGRRRERSYLGFKVHQYRGE